MHHWRGFQLQLFRILEGQTISSFQQYILHFECPFDNKEEKTGTIIPDMIRKLFPSSYFGQVYFSVFAGRSDAAYFAGEPTLKETMAQDRAQTLPKGIGILH